MTDTATTPSIPYPLDGYTYDLADDIDAGLLIRHLTAAHDSNTALATAAGDALARRMVHDAARAALSGCGVSGGTVCGTTADGVRCPGWPGPYPLEHDATDCPTAPRGQDLEDLVTSVAEGAIAKAGRTGRPMVGAVIDADGIARAARRRWAEHAIARLEGRADAFGLDPTDRLTSWAGRYDGAV